MYNTTQFEKDLAEIGVLLSEKQINQFMRYYELLVEWNSFMNLTGITEFEEVMKKHFIDSVSLIKALDLKNRELSLIDIGTGAGFPGIPLKIAFPDLKVTLLDSLNKRISELIDEELADMRKIIKGNRNFRYLVLILVLLVSGFLPQLFNIIAVCFSILINKISIYINLMIDKIRGKEEA